MKPELFTDTNENILKIPVTYGEKGINVEPGQRYSFQVIYSVKLTDIKVGDLIHVCMQGEITNDAGRNRGAKAMYNIMVAGFVSLGKDEKEVTGQKIILASGVNTNPERHHEKIYENGYYTFVNDYAEVYVNCIAYAASTDAVKGDWVDVEKYGRMDVALWR